MREVVVAESWRDKLQDVVVRRKDQWPLLALVGAVALTVVVLAGRSAPAQIAPPAIAQPAPSASPSAALLVHVAGAVRRPGLYEFPAGARVADAVESAGGPAARADLDALNLAELLVDGTKIEVLRFGEVAESPAVVPPDDPTEPATISLNQADQSLLETIPGIGPVTATAILQHRDEVGGFESLEQLLDVDGIGPATFESIRSYLTL